MKKIMFLTVLVVAMVALAAGTAFAGSWWVVNSNKASDVPKWNSNNPDTGYGSGGLTWALDAIEYGASADRSEAFYYRNNGGGGAVSRLSYNSVSSFGPSDQETLSSGTPHGGFSTTTGYCKTCHAVHEAGSGSYRLLKSGATTDHITAQGEGADRTSGEGKLSVSSGYAKPGTTGNAADNGFGTDRSNECMYCHDADAGFSPMRPYALSILTVVRGEHTIGATHVPDRGGVEMTDRDPFDGDGVAATGTLQCYMCHSVHGSNTLGELTVGNSKWGPQIVRLDPNNDGEDLGQSATAAPPITHGTVGGETAGSVTKETNKNIARTAFCVDCHRANSNWDTNAADDLVAGGGAARPNAESHIQGPADDGTMEVYGVDTKVAWDDYKLDDGTLDEGQATEADIEAEGFTSNPSSGCRGCHSAEDHGTEQKNFAGIQSTWPHQTIGPKLLNDALGLANVYGSDVVRSEENSANGNDAGVIGDADRQLINMDAVCLRCHRDNKGGLITADTAGVGITF